MDFLPIQVKRLFLVILMPLSLWCLNEMFVQGMKWEGVLSGTGFILMLLLLQFFARSITEEGTQQRQTMIKKNVD
ncbi:MULTISPECIES: hypothetical protein [Persicobacter]|uniref:Uncharacterized protein n=1 Tax=Persicobacter diffluens TaxID=981 RepID=A0AAN5AMG1_9BACT|nr:hypothetical protein [Persicobacter sp. CCB-QB2]GJM62366.1 hypothetical protein PEDI_29180 [Persicobacter diffluens]